MSGDAGPVVLAAPSGTGKTTLAEKLVRDPGSFVFSVSVTTRAPRPGEVEGAHYRFVDEEAFRAMVRDGHFAEWAEVHGRLYGTPRSALEAAARRGEHVVLDIDVQGARQIRAAVPEARLIFVLPPDVDTLLSRLVGRGSEVRADVVRRLRSALQELQAVEEFDYVVVNDELDSCAETIREIVAGRGGGISAAEAAPRAAALRDAIGGVLKDEYGEETKTERREHA